MWDVPEEVEAYREIASQASGEVLVVGYRLGIVQRVLCSNPEVSSVLTIEKLPEVIEECLRAIGSIHGSHKICDFYEYTSDEKFDCVIGDIWLDYTREHIDEYIRFKEKAKTFIKKNGKILAWGQDYLEYLVSQSFKK